MLGRNSTGQISGQYPPPGVSASLARPASADGTMPAQKRRRMDDLVTPSLDGADEINEPDPDGNDPRTNELHQNWAPASDLKRYLYHTTPEEFVKRINSLISPDLAVSCHS